MVTYWITGLLVAVSSEGKSVYLLDYRPTCSNVSRGQEWSYTGLPAYLQHCQRRTGVVVLQSTNSENQCCKRRKKERKRKEKNKRKENTPAFSWFFSGFTKSGKGTDSVTDGFQLFVAETDRPTGRDGSRDNDDGV